MDLLKIGQKIREKRDTKSQMDFVEELNKKLTLTFGFAIENSRLSRIENGKESNEDVYKKICDVLDIEYTDSRLRVAFSQGFWAAPLIWMNAQLATDEFFDTVQLTSYSDLSTNTLVFSKKGERLPPFKAEEHAFFYSGEIMDLLQEDKIDVGFLGNTVLENAHDVVRVGRLVNADSMRHGMIVVAPKRKFADKKSLIKYLLKPDGTKTNECHIYYHPKSTAEREFRALLQRAGHSHDTLYSLNLHQFRQVFKTKVREHEGCVLGHIGLMLTIENAKKAVQELDPNNVLYDVFAFRTNEIVDVAKEWRKEIPIEKAIELGIEDIENTNFYYEMVVLRSNKKIQDLAHTNKGFRLLLKLLRTSVREFKSTQKDKGIPLTHRKVADFFGLDLQQASDMLKKTEFELVFYPEWINKVLDII